MDILCTHIWQISWYFVLSQKSQIRRENLYSLKFWPEKYRKKGSHHFFQNGLQCLHDKKKEDFFLLVNTLSTRVASSSLTYHYNYYEKRTEAKKECIISLIFHAWCMNNKNTHNLQKIFYRLLLVYIMCLCEWWCGVVD